MADNPTHRVRNILLVIVVAGIITFAAGFGLDLADDTLSAAKDALNSGVEALISVVLTSAGIVGRSLLTK